MYNITGYIGSWYIGYLVFKMLESNKIMRVHVFESFNYIGNAIETDEMRPQWYNEKGC